MKKYTWCGKVVKHTYYEESAEITPEQLRAVLKRVPKVRLFKWQEDGLRRYAKLDKSVIGTFKGVDK